MTNHRQEINQIRDEVADAMHRTAAAMRTLSSAIDNLSTTTFAFAMAVERMMVEKETPDG